MLGFLIPDALQRLFVDWAGELPLRLQTVSFAALCAAVIVILAYLLRAVLLRLDCEWAVRARLRVGRPGLMPHAIGWIGYRQFQLAIAILSVFIVSAVFFDAARGGLLPGSSDSFFSWSVRAVFLCLRPGSGNQPDSLLSCPILG